jgi:hypothetical protein
VEGVDAGARRSSDAGRERESKKASHGDYRVDEVEKPATSSDNRYDLDNKQDNKTKTKTQVGNRMSDSKMKDEVADGLPSTPSRCLWRDM